MKNAIAMFVVVFMLSGIDSAWAEGLDTLIEVAKSQGDIAKSYSEETKAYDGIKRASGSGAIAKGQSSKAIAEKYGDPVVEVTEYGTDRQKWIYKPQTSDFFKGPRISLFFTKDGVLDEISEEDLK